MAVNIMPRSMCQCCYCCQCLRRSPDNPFVLKRPMLLEEETDFEVADPGPALAAALQRPGGQAQALRHLKALVDRHVDPLKHITPDQLSRTLRIGRRFDEFVDLARPDFGEEGWSSGIVDESKLWFAYRIDTASRSMHVVLVQDIPGTDPVKAAAGYCAAGLFQRHSVDVQSCRVLAQSEDSLLWNQVRESRDDVVQVDLVNALDESLGAIMLMIHPEPDGSPDFPEAAVPKPCRTMRSGLGKQCLTFTPLPGGAVRMHVAALTCFSDEKALLDLVRTPTDGVAKLLRPLLTLWPRRFASLLEEHRADLVNEEAFSRQAPFYAVCRGYLAGRAGSRRRRSSLHRWGYIFDREWAE